MVQLPDSVSKSLRMWSHIHWNRLGFRVCRMHRQRLLQDQEALVDTPTLSLVLFGFTLQTLVQVR